VLGAVSACSQPFTLGANLGIPATRLLGAVDSSDIGYQSYTNRYLIGPHRRAAAEVGPGGPLYRHYGFWSAGTISAGKHAQDQRPVQPGGVSAAGEIPASDKLARPFVDAGFAWDTLEGFGQSVIVV
jgi:hypothetical protein